MGPGRGALGSIGNANTPVSAGIVSRTVLRAPGGRTLGVVVLVREEPTRRYLYEALAELTDSCGGRFAFVLD
jgi:hypothetical protein